MAKKTHIFIGGLHRSGTSLLHHIIRSHPDVSGFSNTQAPKDEGQHLQQVFPPANAYGGVGKFAFHHDAHLDETSSLITEKNKKTLYHQWGELWDANKPYLVEKSPPNIIRTRFLQTLFPNSHFIILVRHPLATGYATQKWSETDIRELVEHWVMAHQIFMEDRLHLKHCIVIRYEDLVKNPDSVLRRVYNKIGLAPHPTSETVMQGVNQKYFAMWEREIKNNPSVLQRISLLQALPKHFGYVFNAPYVTTKTRI